MIKIQAGDRVLINNSGKVGIVEQLARRADRPKDSSVWARIVLESSAIIWVMPEFITKLNDDGSYIKPKATQKEIQELQERIRYHRSRLNELESALNYQLRQYQQDSISD